MRDDAQAWADAFIADLALAPIGQRRALIEGKVTRRGNTERDTATTAMRRMSTPERVPGTHALARQQLIEQGQNLACRVGELRALGEHPAVPQDVKFAVSTQLPGLIEFAAVLTNAAIAGSATA